MEEIYNGEKVFEAEAWPNEEFVENHDDFSHDEISHPLLESGSKRLSVDRLCSESNTVDNVCTIKDMSLRFSNTLRYETKFSLVFDNSKIKCLSISYAPCSFEFIMHGGQGS